MIGDRLSAPKADALPGCATPRIAVALGKPADSGNPESDVRGNERQNAAGTGEASPEIVPNSDRSQPAPDWRPIDTAAPLKTGFHPTEQCARGEKNCRSLQQILSTDDSQLTITCCGEVLNGDTPHPGDQWSLCIRSHQGRAHCAGTDLRIFVDRQDISHIASVLTYARALIDSADLHNPAFEAAIGYPYGEPQP